MLRTLVPETLAVRELWGPLGDLALLPAEAVVVAGAVTKRRSEFAAGRHCAHAALAALGCPLRPLLPGRGGAPQWPPGLTGSITHCQGYAAAAVGPTSEVATVGVDAEPHEPLHDGVLDLVATPTERRHLEVLGHHDRDTHWDRLLFSAKESIYKAWFPLTGAWLDFGDIEIAVRASGCFTGVFLVPGPVVGGRCMETLLGRFALDEGLILTAVTVPSLAPPATTD